VTLYLEQEVVEQVNTILVTTQLGADMIKVGFGGKEVKPSKVEIVNC
jgi:hypothetical protein